MSDFIVIENRSQTQLALSGAASQTPLLLPGLYDVVSDVDCYLKVALVANDVAVNTGYPLFAGNQITLEVKDQRRIGAITGGLAGTLKIHQVR